jgi:hypothetical protein
MRLVMVGLVTVNDINNDDEVVEMESNNVARCR